MVINDVREREKEVSLLLVLEAVFLSETQFLGDARDAERLAGKTGAEDVMFGNVRHGHGMDVAMRFLAEVGFVSDLRHLVPVGGKDTRATRFLKRDAESADTTEEVNEPQLVV